MWWPVISFWIVLSLVSVAAWRWGGGAEKSAAAMYVVAALLTVLARFPGTSRFQNLQVIPALIDIALLLGLIVLASKVDRWWPIWSAAVQSTAVLGHIARMEAQTLPFSYFMAVVGSAFPTLLLLTLGIANHQRRTARAARSEPRVTPTR